MGRRAGPKSSLLGVVKRPPQQDRGRGSLCLWREPVEAGLNWSKTQETPACGRCLGLSWLVLAGLGAAQMASLINNCLIRLGIDNGYVCR